MFNDIIKAINIEPYYRDNNVAIFNGDCRDILPLLSNIDAIVTDPPYELGFMGKSWDSTGIAYDLKVWQGCINALKNGGHLLAFGGTRTYHRMACAIEDAGFEIRDMIEWVYGSGFPKSLNIGKAIDKIRGNEREVVGDNPNKRPNSQPNYSLDGNGKNFSINVQPITKGTSEWEGWGTALKPAHEPVCLARKPIKGTVAQNVLEYGVGGLNIDGCRVPAKEGFADWVSKTANPNGTNKGIGRYGDEFQGIGKTFDNYKPKADARFPANLIHDGQVDEIFPETKSGIAVRHNSGGNTFGGNNPKPIMDDLGYGDSGSAARFFYQAQWTPEELNILEANTSNELKQKWIEIAKLYNDIDLTPIEAFIASMLNDGLSGCSMKYCAKASKSEKDANIEGIEKQRSGSMQGCIDDGDFLTGSGNKRQGKSRNNHPTVKPLALMEYLIKLITPPKGIVLDPFMGSGSTLIAARKLGYKAIGIELNKDYAEIAKKRLAQGVLL